MNPTGLLLTVLALAVLAVTILIFAAVVRHAPRARSAKALALGDFPAAVAAARAGAAEELVPASIAARHLGDFDKAARLADRAVRLNPDDGEAWLELGLVRGFAGELDEADVALVRAVTERSDLAEAVTLHRAWLALRGDDRETARRLFEEVEAPLETKLELDLGSGDPVFADWFFHAGELWRALGNDEKGHWALGEARRSAPGSRLFGQR